MNTKNKGDNCEETVAKYLKDKGYSILERNFRIPQGEIDIIATKNNCLCAVEVKSMSINWDESEILYKITPKKIRNIKMTLSYYLVNCCKYKYDKIRFDVASVRNGIINYYEGAI